MHKLFILSHLRTLARLGVTEFTPTAWQEIAAKNSLAPSGDGMLYRLPREELKHVLNMHCPVNTIEQPHAESIIKAAKALRSHAKIVEEKICSKCPFVHQCAHANKPSEVSDQESSMKNLLLFFHGLQNLLKPEAIYYRQWVGAYRLGDSLISSIDDLSKGGKEIEEYDRLRLEGIKQYQERKELKKKEAGLDQSDKEFQDVMSKVDAVAAEKPKKKAKKEEVQQEKPAEEAFGRDFSFDEEAEFEPVQKFTKNSPEKAVNPKGYQRIEQNDERPAKGAKASFNKFRPEKEPIEELEQEFHRQKPRGENRKPYDKYDGQRSDKFERSERGDNRGKYERGQWDNQRSDREFRGQKNDRYGGDRDQNRYGDRDQNRYGDRDQNRYGDREKSRYGDREQGRFGGDREQSNRYSNDRKADYKQNRQREPEDDFPKIREFGKSQRQRDSAPQQQQFTKPAAKSNPFVSKWKPEEETYEAPKSKSFAKKGAEEFAKPKIVQVENINEGSSSQGSQGRSGRRRRPRSSSSAEQ